jgi:membrane fusion protein (multidrug efflux system)
MDSVGSTDRKYEEDAGPDDRSESRVIQLDNSREKMKAPVIPDDELESPVAPEPMEPETETMRPPLAAPQAPTKARRNWKRPVLFALLPVALIAGGYYYVVGGQIMTTDNAYIRARSLGVSTDVSGTVAEIDVHDNEQVKKGQVLFRLRSASFESALAAARAQLGTVRNQVETLKATYRQMQAQIAQAEADLPYYEASLKRQQDLLATSTASKASFDQARHDLVSAQQKVTVAKAQAQSVLAQLGGDAEEKVEDNPLYIQAETAVGDAQRDLDDSVVKAPFDGVVTNVDSLQVGKYLESSQPGFSLVGSKDLWIEANPKETELTHVRPGQKATISIDTYPGVEWHGTVASVSPASSSSFSLLPAQNTSGNWVKVVQRIPMRVTIEDPQGKPPLRGGMSAEVSIDTGHARGLPMFISNLIDRFGKKNG